MDKIFLFGIILMAFLEISGHDLVNIIIAFLGSGGFLGGIYALLKLRPEAGMIQVTAAQGAIVVATGVIDALKDELARVREELKQVEAENEILKKRIAEFEKIIASHTGRIEEIENKS